MTVTKEGSYSLTVEEITEENELELLVSADDGPFLATHNDRRGFYARCDCGEKHPGRPPQLTKGCGQRALIEPPPDE